MKLAPNTALHHGTHLLPTPDLGGARGLALLLLLLPLLLPTPRVLRRRVIILLLLPLLLHLGRRRLRRLFPRKDALDPLLRFLIGSTRVQGDKSGRGLGHGLG